IDVTARKRADERQNLLIAELDHRVKNALASVSVIAQHTRQNSASMDQFLQALDSRILSMSRAHALLSRSRWEGVNLAHLVHEELGSFTASGNSKVEGPDIILISDAVQPLVMVLHELVTNAGKYGALSSPHGCVIVRWNLRRSGRIPDGLVLEWKEMG